MPNDFLYERAVEYVKQENDTSCAGLQRNLEIPYKQALALRTKMEKEGIFLNLRAKEKQTPFFTPWVGTNYAASEERLLILGESHYGDESMSGHSTITFTQEYVDGQNHRFWTSTMQAVRGQPYWELDRKEFWQGVAFYNYVQQPVAETAGVAPSAEMFSSSKDAFFSVLSQLTPKKILVLSNRLWQNMPEGGLQAPHLTYGEDTRETLLYQYDGGEALACWVPHPSYGFSWQAWHPMIKALLDQPLALRG